MSKSIHTGRCGCGAVSFTVTGALPEAGACHCSQCRRQTGLYYVTVNVDDTALAWAGLEAATVYRSSDTAGRGFCIRCGSAVYWKEDGSTVTSLMAGLFDMPSDLRLGYHIFCADKGDFYEIADDLPHHPQWNPTS